jgi:Flp pilus assembly protein TadG
MSRSVYILDRFIVSTRGIAAVEFAIIMPILILLFLASVDAGGAIAIYMKVRSATYTLGTITNICGDVQSSSGPCQTPITAAGIQQITAAAATVLSPYSSSPLTATVSQLKVNANGQATVSWSYSLNGTARTQGSSVSIPTTLATNFTTTYNPPITFPQYLIFGEASYQYTPLFTHFVTHAITLSDSVYVAPRNSTCITYINPPPCP